jgi:hypothetical protein
MGINEALMRAGTAQRSVEQQYLDSLAEEFAARQNYPYRNLGFLSDIIRGTPLTDSTQTLYRAPGSAAGQAAGLAYGVGSLLGR